MGLLGDGSKVSTWTYPFKNPLGSGKISSVRLGKLAVKEEPSGKVRVFAIADLITQTIMRPLHNAIFDLIRTIPQDGTFNQIRPLEILSERYSKGLIKGF